MEQILINLVAGAVGGNAVGKASPAIDMGTILNSVTGVVGGGILGQLIPLVLPALMSGNLNISNIITQVIGGGAGGAILTALIGLVKNKAA